MTNYHLWLYYWPQLDSIIRTSRERLTRNGGLFALQMKLTTLKPRLKIPASKLAVINPGSWRTDKQTSCERGYGYKWQQARKAFLRSHPLCVYCERDGRLTAASVVDHIEPHRGDMVKFWDSGNWQSLCHHCHDSVKQRLERSGIAVGCDMHGVPTDAGHHWNR